MEELKPCPFCGSEAILVRVQYGNKLNPTTIIDKWEVRCKNGCCRSLQYSDEIFHADDGEIVVEKNGAKDAVKSWNRRV